MREFDVSKEWIILAAAGTADRPIERAAARELAYWLGTLRGRCAGNAEGSPIPVRAADAPAPSESTPIIVLNAGESSNGFSWRAGEERVEIYGDSPKGLMNGVFDFLNSLGFSWENPGNAHFPTTQKNGEEIARTRFPLSRSGAYDKANDDDQAIVVEGAREEPSAELVRRAARNKASVVRLGRKIGEAVHRLASEYGLAVEADGPPVGSLIPKILFPFRPDLFRMENGRRKATGCFCPTNPRAVELAAKRAARFFRRFPEADVYRFIGSTGTFDRALCSCPTCRAFTPAEQTLMAANAIAAALAKSAPKARLLLEIDPSDENASVILPRANLLIRRARPQFTPRTCGPAGDRTISPPGPS